VGEVSRNLVFLFFTTEFARQTTAAMAGRAPEKDLVVGIIGGGLMGLALSKLAAVSGYKVLLRAQHREAKSGKWPSDSGTFPARRQFETQRAHYIGGKTTSQYKKAARSDFRAAAENEKNQTGTTAQMTRL